MAGCLAGVCAPDYNMPLCHQASSSRSTSIKADTCGAQAPCLRDAAVVQVVFNDVQDLDGRAEDEHLQAQRRLGPGGFVTLHTAAISAAALPQGSAASHGT